MSERCWAFGCPYVENVLARNTFTTKDTKVAQRYAKKTAPGLIWGTMGAVARSRTVAWAKTPVPPIGWKTKKACDERTPVIRIIENLLFGFAVLGRWSSAFRLRLGFGLFHGLLRFGSTLGAGFGALLTLLVQDCLAA